MFDRSPVKILKLKSSVFSDFVGLKTAIVGRGENFFFPVSGCDSPACLTKNPLLSK
jgi:hypothetical protein